MGLPQTCSSLPAEPQLCLGSGCSQFEGESSLVHEFGAMRTIQVRRQRCAAVSFFLALDARVCVRVCVLFVPLRAWQHRWLALHGFLDNAASYDRFAPEMLNIGASSVVCLDFAGHGRTDWRQNGVYYVFDHVADVVYAADALKWETFSMYAAPNPIP